MWRRTLKKKQQVFSFPATFLLSQGESRGHENLVCPKLFYVIIKEM